MRGLWDEELSDACRARFMRVSGEQGDGQVRGRRASSGAGAGISTMWHGRVQPAEGGGLSATGCVDRRIWLRHERGCCGSVMGRRWGDIEDAGLHGMGRARAACIGFSGQADMAQAQRIRQRPGSSRALQGCRQVESRETRPDQTFLIVTSLDRPRKFTFLTDCTSQSWRRICSL